MAHSILALDLGTQTGWAHGHIGQDKLNTVSGTESFKGDRFSGAGMRFLRFRRWLEEMYVLVGFEELHFEEVRGHKGVDAAHVYGGLMATLQIWCEEKQIPYSGTPVGTIKKFATGKGNANKAVMMETVQSWGYQPEDDNQADAIALLHCTMGVKA